MATLGQFLKGERDAQGISLKEISTATKISLKYLEALEADDWAVFSGAFFAKSILRTYARSVGIDEKTVLDRFNEVSGQGDSAAGEAKRAPNILESLTRRHWTILAGIVAAAVLIIVGFVLIPGGKERGPAPTAPAPQQTQSLPVAKPKVILPEQPPAKPEAKELELEIAFSQLTWIQVFADGEMKLDGLMEAGREARIKAGRELLIHVGNAGGLAYTLNGKPGNPLGRAGAVVKNIRITLDNYLQYLAPGVPGAEKAPPGM